MSNSNVTKILNHAIEACQITGFGTGIDVYRVLDAMREKLDAGEQLPCGAYTLNDEGELEQGDDDTPRLYWNAQFCVGAQVVLTENTVLIPTLGGGEHCADVSADARGFRIEGDDAPSDTFWGDGNPQQPRILEMRDGRVWLSHPFMVCYTMTYTPEIHRAAEWAARARTLCRVCATLAYTALVASIAAGVYGGLL